MDLKHKLEVLKAVEDAAYDLVKELAAILPGKKILFKKEDYSSGDYNNPDMIEKIVTVETVSYYESELTIRCKDSKGNFEYLSSYVDMEILEDDDPRNI